MHYRDRSPTRNRPKAPGGTLIFSYIGRLGSFYGVRNFEFHFIFGSFQKNEYFCGYGDFVDCFFFFFLGGGGGDILVLLITTVLGQTHQYLTT